ncbi:MAG: hypothetical protein H6581_21310 [Bacteroidia bacterium]|nr:hypothetical protein [Bacteroidia bacterium]
MESNPNTHLSEVLKSYSTSTLQKTYQEACNRRRNEVITFLQKEYGKELAGSPFASGSLAKGTAISLGYDLDVVVPFHHQALGGLEKIFDQVGKSLQRQFQGLSYRRQRVSHRIVFTHKSKPIRIEVVPAMDCVPNGFQATQDLQLWNSAISRPIKTNLQRQVECLRQMDDRKKQIIRLLKGWKIHKNVKVPSYLLELIVYEAFLDDEILLQEKLFDRLLGVLEYIKKEFPRRGFKDWGNKSNDLKVSMTEKEQGEFHSQVVNLLNKLTANEMRVTELF